MSSVAEKVQVYGVVVGRDAFYGRLVEAGHVMSGWYASLVEHGSSRVAAHPFFRPAVDAKSAQAVKAMVDVMQSKLDEANNV